jgi:hypothetical protein
MQLLLFVEQLYFVFVLSSLYCIASLLHVDTDPIWSMLLLSLHPDAHRRLLRVWSFSSALFLVCFVGLGRAVLGAAFRLFI